MCYCHSLCITQRHVVPVQGRARVQNCLTAGSTVPEASPVSFARKAVVSVAVCQGLAGFFVVAKVFFLLGFEGFCRCQGFCFLLWFQRALQWMDGWMDGWRMDGCMDAWMHGCMGAGCMDGCMDAWMDGLDVHVPTDIHGYLCTYVYIYICICVCLCGMREYTCMHTHTCTYACMYVYIYMYVFICTWRQFWSNDESIRHLSGKEHIAKVGAR